VRLQIRYSIILLFLFPSVLAHAQLDTNYVKTYKDKLVVSLFQLYRTQRINIQQTSVPDSTGNSVVNYSSSSKLMNGFSFDWDKLSLAVSWKTPTAAVQGVRQGVSRSRNIGVSFNLKKVRIENTWRSYRGFFDANTANLPAFTDSTPFYQNNNLSVVSFKTKALYFVNKKNRFSYAAAYANTQRQLKSAISFMWVGNVYYQKISSNESIIPSIMDTSYFQQYRQLKSVQLAGISVNPGFSANIVVLKSFFINITIAWGPQLEWRTLDKGEEGIAKELQLSINNGETRVSFGYNGDRLMLYSWTMGDYDNLQFKDITINREMLSGGLTLGYRFNLKPNHITKKIKENKYYKKL
jgi:hypothetical protein